jgi:hypothetical protein
MKGYAVAALFSVFLLNLLSINLVFGGQFPEARPFDMARDVYQKYAQQHRRTDVRHAPDKLPPSRGLRQKARPYQSPPHKRRRNQSPPHKRRPKRGLQRRRNTVRQKSSELGRAPINRA